MAIIFEHKKKRKNSNKIEPYNGLKKVQQGLLCYGEGHPDGYIGFENNGGSLEYAHVKDSKGKDGMAAPNLDEFLKPEQVKLKSFDTHDTLNPEIWDGLHLDGQVRLKLMDIADDFIEFIDVPWVEPEDVVITGSIANYNWSKYSDIDVHVIIPFKEVGEKPEFVKEYFNGKKKIWTTEHDELKIHEFPIEFYVQDTKEKHASSGIYSLWKNEWIKEPKEGQLSSDDMDKNEIKSKISKYTKIIDDLEGKVKKGKIEDDILEAVDKAKEVFKKLREARQEELLKNGEMCVANIVFKWLRRFGYIEKLVKMQEYGYDKANSIE